MIWVTALAKSLQELSSAQRRLSFHNLAQLAQQTRVMVHVLNLPELS